MMKMSGMTKQEKENLLKNIKQKVHTLVIKSKDRQCQDVMKIQTSV